MPYIKPHLRKQLDPLINELSDAAREAAGPDFIAHRGGILNYIFTRLALQFVRDRSYASLSQMKAAMSDAADEWYRRQMAV